MEITVHFFFLTNQKLRAPLCVSIYVSCCYVYLSLIIGSQRMFFFVTSPSMFLSRQQRTTPPPVIPYPGELYILNKLLDAIIDVNGEQSVEDHQKLFMVSLFVRSAPSSSTSADNQMFTPVQALATATYCRSCG